MNRELMARERCTGEDGYTLSATRTPGYWTLMGGQITLREPK
jgi:hypothetical protein